LWFAKIQRDVIARGIFTLVADLARKLRKYIRAYAKSAKPFHWTYTDPRRRLRTYEITGTDYSVAVSEHKLESPSNNDGSQTAAFLRFSASEVLFGL
jgi:hypothetical protein